MQFYVAIDGPAGAGKSTVARLVGHALGMPYVDTGAMYRGVALVATETGAALTDEALTPLASALALRFQPTAEGQRVLLDNRDVTQLLRSADIGSMVSAVAKFPGVRSVLMQRQRQMAAEESSGVVMDGRDIGTHVLPEADVKLYLTATLDSRAARRHADLLQQGYKGSVAEVMKLMHERDEEDGRRTVAPMRPAKDAVLLDTTPLSIDEVVAMIVALCVYRLGVKRERTGLHV